MMVVCEEDCAVIGYQLFMVMVSVLGLATEEFVTTKALGISEEHLLLEEARLGQSV
jgi:hypothetical protein